MMDPRDSETLAENINKTISTDLRVAREPGPEPGTGASFKNRYSITGKLGEGGMGAVYSAFDNQLQQKVAIKLLKRSMSKNEKAVEQLKGEALVAMKLTHPLIMRLINFERDGADAFLLMELVDGRTLDSIVKERPDKKLSPKTAAQIAYKVCEALEYAHANGVIHRDIKPANIMIETGKNTVKLMDFGIARAITEGTAEKPPIAGTLPYIAPEALEGAMPSPRTDIYALGLTLYELVAGVHPFKGKGTKEIIQMHATVTPPPIEGIDRQLMNIIAQCVEKKPNARFQSAQEIRSALAGYLDMSEARFSREKKRVESEKKRIGFELKKLEREREKLKTQQENMEGMASTPRIVHGVEEKKGGLIEGLPVSLPVAMTLGAALAAGLLGAFIERAVKTGELGIFGSVTANEYFATALVCALVGGTPAFVRRGASAVMVGGATGFLAGIAAASYGLSYIDQSLENLVTPPYQLISYLVKAVPMALAATAAYVAHHGFGVAAIRSGGMALALAVAGAVLPYIGFAEGVLEMADESTGLFYVPFIALVVWGALAYVEND